VAESYPRHRPGDRQLSAAAANRQAEATSRRASLLGAVGLGRANIPGGLSTNPGPAQSLWIRITETPGTIFWPDGPCPNAYGWEEVTYDGRVGHCTWGAPGDGRSGHTDSFPAYEVNGSARVPMGSRVRAWFAADGSGLEFAYPCKCPCEEVSPNTWQIDRFALTGTPALCCPGPTGNLWLQRTSFCIWQAGWPAGGADGTFVYPCALLGNPGPNVLTGTLGLTYPDPTTHFTGISVLLSFAFPAGIPGPSYGGLTADFDCVGPNVLPLIADLPGNPCTWPATITIRPV
jgi:hypothetical protein